MKKVISLEGYIGGVSRVEVDVIEEKNGKLLVKTWDGYKVLANNGKYWYVEDWGREIPESWK